MFFENVILIFLFFSFKISFKIKIFKNYNQTLPNNLILKYFNTFKNNIKNNNNHDLIDMLPYIIRIYIYEIYIIIDNALLIMMILLIIMILHFLINYKYFSTMFVHPLIILSS